jgi:hypothetical protein
MSISTSKCRISTVSSLPVRFLSMGILFVSVCFTNIAFAQGEGKSNIPSKNINITHIYMMFDNIKNNTNWDTTANLRWSYYFSHSDRTLLDKAKKKLVAKGYKFVDLNISEDDNEFAPIGSYYLQIEKIETHTPTSLDKRNDEFFIFANELGLDSYGGMDAGPVVKNSY